MPETTTEELREVILDEAEPDKKILVGTLLSPGERKELISVLRRNKDVFAWTHQDMMGVDPEEASHHLNIDPKFPAVKQKQRRFAPEWNRIISEEVDRLLEVGAIEPCQYP